MSVLATVQSFEIDDDPARLDVDMMHAFLTKSYWAAGIEKPAVQRLIDGSWNFGVYHGADEQIGYARLITDRASFAYLADVFVLPDYQGFGLGKWMLSVMFAQPDVLQLKRILLVTQDAQELYRRFGFSPIRKPERFMEWRPTGRP